MKLLACAATLAAMLLSALNAYALDLPKVPKDIRVGPASLAVSKKEMLCLAINDYWEARGESLKGRIAVAQVVLNRARDPRFPGTICDVITENRSSKPGLCQFSWYCDGRDDVPHEKGAWRSSILLAISLLRPDNAVNDITDGALWYHHERVSPGWSKRLQEVTQVGVHVFYGDLPSKDTGTAGDTAVAERTTGTMPTTFVDWVDGKGTLKSVEDQ